MKSVARKLLSALIAAAACLCIAGALNRSFPAPGMPGLTFRMIPLGAENPHGQIYELKGIDFTGATSLTVAYRLVENSRDPRPPVLFLIPDMRPGDFRCARLSALPMLPSAYLTYSGGIPLASMPLKKSVRGETNTFTVEIGDAPGKMPAPREGLFIFSRPPPDRLRFNDFTLHSTGGRSRRIPLTPGLPAKFVIPPALALCAALLLLDRNTLRRAVDPALARALRSRIDSVRFAGALILAPAAYGAMDAFLTPGGQKRALFLPLALIAALWSALGGYPRKKDFATWGATGRLPRLVRFVHIAAAAALFATIIPAIVIISHQRGGFDSFTRNNIFRKKTVKRTNRNSKIILCLGGSSTAGEPFGQDWPFDYPSLMEKSLAREFPGIRVANAGIPATNITHAAENLPALMRSPRPDVVFFDYLQNDTTLLGIRSLHSTLTSLLPASMRPASPADFYREKLSRAIAAARSRGAKTAVVLEPDYDYIYHGIDNYAQARRIAAQTALASGATLIDPNPEFRRNAGMFLFIDDNVHLTRYGSQLLADILSREAAGLLR